MRTRRHHLLQRVTTLACIVVGTLVLAGTVSAFFVPGIQAALTLPRTQILSPSHATPSVQPMPTAMPSLIPTAMPSPTATPSLMPTVAATPQPSVAPAAATILAQDNFQRADQALWGISSGGQPWSGDAKNSQSFSIMGMAGQVSGGQSFFNALLGPSATDAEVVFSGSVSHFGPSQMGALLRWTNNQNWYKAYLDGTHFILARQVAGKFTQLRTVAFLAQDATSYTLRFRVIGSMLMAKAWPTGQIEPTTWMLMATDTTLTAGFGGLRFFVQGGVVARITMFMETVATAMA